jgi:hypothetical protein
MCAFRKAYQILFKSPGILDQCVGMASVQRILRNIGGKRRHVVFIESYQIAAFSTAEITSLSQGITGLSLKTILLYRSMMAIFRLSF